MTSTSIILLFLLVDIVIFVILMALIFDNRRSIEKLQKPVSNNSEARRGQWETTEWETTETKFSPEK